jgi:alkylated DNA repair dioxygenase AlkB
MQISLPDADLQLFPQHFPIAVAEKLFLGLKNNIPWVQNRIKFYGKESLVPRLESWHGDEGMSYTYSGIRIIDRTHRRDLF